METKESTSGTYIVLDRGYLTIKKKIGEGGFCKVKACTAQVNRKELDEIIPGTQELACKIYKKK